MLLKGVDSLLGVPREHTVKYTILTFKLRSSRVSSSSDTRIHIYYYLIEFNQLLT